MLDNGRLVEEGTHETLMAKEGGQYKKIFKSQQNERVQDGISEIDDTKELETLKRECKGIQGWCQNNIFEKLFFIYR